MSNRVHRRTGSLSVRRIRSKQSNQKKQKNNDKLVFYRQPGRFAPDKLKVKLIFQDPTASRTVTSSNAMNWGYRSSAYDPDPALLTGAIPGFVELANLYMEYCVHSMHLSLEIANQNTESVIVAVWPSNVLQNVNSLSFNDIQEYSGNLLAKSRLLANSSGQNRTIIRTLASGLQLVGTRFRTDLTYSSSTSTNPAQTFALNIGIADPLGNFAFPMVIRSRVTYSVEFFKLRQLET
jgi:hypothetical protein